MNLAPRTQGRKMTRNIELYQNSSAHSEYYKHTEEGLTGSARPCTAPLLAYAGTLLHKRAPANQTSKAKNHIKHSY